MKKTPRDINILQECTKNHDHMLFWAIFCPISPPCPLSNSLKNQQKRKTPGDIILHMCTKNYDQMRYGS